MAHKQSSSTDADRQQRLSELKDQAFVAAQSHFDPIRHLIAQPAGDQSGQRTYRQAQSLPLAYEYLSQGSKQSLTEGAAIIAAVLESQELNPAHPHAGNWRWLADDPEIGDLNAVQFVMRGLLPILIDHEARLPAPLVEECQVRVRLGLAEEERLDVAPSYTNIHIMSLFALLAGAEWLGDPHFLRLGQDRWTRWVTFMLRSGAPHEYNSPGYGGVDLSGLAVLVHYVQDRTIRLQAKLIYERFWLHLALHIHRPSGQLAGPHCRAYWRQMITGRASVKEILWRETGWDWPLAASSYGGDSDPPADLELALTPHALPDYLITWFERQFEAMPYEVRETANRDEGFDLTTYLTPTYALGTASKTYAIGTDCYYIEHHANYLMLHYTRPAQGGRHDREETGATPWGMMYSRYVVNDRHWGTMGAAPDRPKDSNFYDHGNFAGVQLRNKAIGLYALQPQPDEVFSLKTVVAFQSGAALDEVRINEIAVDPAEIAHQPLQPGDWLIVADGDVYIAVRPLEPSVLSHSAPIKLERGPLGELWLAIYNYDGPAIRFWDYASLKGAFWRGNLKAGFVVEVSERRAYASAREFLTYLRRSHVADSVDEDHIRTVTYSNGGESLSLRYDLWNTVPVARYLNGEAYSAPQLSSPLAVQGDTGYLEAGKARLFGQPQPLWLIAQELDPAGCTYVAVNPGQPATPLRLETPAGTLQASAWSMGRLEWRVPGNGDGRQVVILEGLEPPADLSVPDGVQIIWRPVPENSQI